MEVLLHSYIQQAWEIQWCVIGAISECTSKADYLRSAAVFRGEKTQVSPHSHFIRLQITLSESEYISYTIHEWIKPISLSHLLILQ
jgi:hypothetical protein